LKPTVFLTRRIPSAPLRALEAACEVDRYDGPGELPHAELLARVAGKQGLVCVLNDSIGADVFEAGRDLAVIANIAVGFNNIDIAAARARGIIVTNTPDVLTEASADHTWGLILGITRRIAEGDRLIRRGGWKAWGLDFMLGAELRGKQLGIVGFGRIGRAVAARASAFGMRVAHTMRGKSTAAPAAPDGSVVAMPLDQLLATSDVVSLHVPLTPETRHLIDQPSLARMKRNAYLINTSRGPVVDEEALAWALRERMISGAALDVFEREPEVHPDLLALENVLLVPHLASATVETRTAMADLAVRNAIAVLSGQPPITPVP
jgi:glyoxylate reductase